MVTIRCEICGEEPSIIASSLGICSECVKKHPEEAKYQLRLIRPAYTKNWRELAKDTAHALGMLFMKTCEFIAGWIGSVELEI